MRFLNSNINKFGLHDTSVNNVEYIPDYIIFTLDSGVYFLNIDGKEIEKTSSCIIKIKISGLNENTLFQHIEIVKYKYNKRKIREIQFSDFTKMLEKNEFNIEFDYYSDFARSILLIGDVKDSAIVIRIEDIENIEFVFV